MDPQNQFLAAQMVGLGNQSNPRDPLAGLGDQPSVGGFCQALPDPVKGDKRVVEISDDSLDVIRFALKLAKADAEIDLAKARFAGDDDRAIVAERRADAVEKALDEVPSR